MGVLAALGKMKGASPRLGAVGELAGRAAKSLGKAAWENSGATDVPVLKWAGTKTGNLLASSAERKEKKEKKVSPSAQLAQKAVKQLQQPKTPEVIDVEAKDVTPKSKRATPQKDARGKFISSKPKPEKAASTTESIEKTKVKAEEGRARVERAESTKIQQHQVITGDQVARDVHVIAKLMEEQGFLLSKIKDQKSGAEAPGLLGSIAGMAGPGLLGKAGKWVAQGGAKLLGKIGLGAAATAGAGSLLSGGVKAATTVAEDGTKALAGTVAKEGGELAATTGAKAVGGVVAKEGAEVAGKGLGKSLIKKIPIIGALAGLGFGAKRAMAGDWEGAGLEVASGVAGIFPGIGTAASVGIDAGLAARDIHRAVNGVGPDGKPIVVDPGAAQPAALATALKASDGQPVRSSDGTPVVTSAAVQPISSPSSPLREDSTDVTNSLLGLILGVMTDSSKGIFVRPSDDPFSKPLQLNKPDTGTTAPPAAPASRQEALSPSPSAPSTQIQRPKDLPGVGFVPNAERTSARPFLGNEAVPTPRQDISAQTRRDPSVALQSPTTPTVGVAYGTQKGFKGFGGDVDSHIKEASAKYGMDEKTLRGFVKMEGGWQGAMSPTGAIGTGQFIQPTWDGLAKTKEGQDIGMTKIGSRFRTSEDPRFDKRTNTLATALLAKQNGDQLKAAGLEASGENLYMMHNIGPGVIPALQGKSVSSSTMLAMQQNGMKPGQTPQDFVAMQKGKFASHYAAANAVQPAPGQQVVSDTQMAAAKPAQPVIADRGAVKSVPTAQVQTAQALSTSQQGADAQQAKPIVVAMAAPQEQAPMQRKGPGAAQGDTKPAPVVRNNESSLRRVTDNMIAKTIT